MFPSLTPACRRRRRTSSHITSDISGNITTVGTFSPAIEMISKRNAEGSASNLLYFHDGVATIGAGSNAVSLWTGNTASTTGSGEVHIGGFGKHQGDQ